MPAARAASTSAPPVAGDEVADEATAASAMPVPVATRAYLRSSIGEVHSRAIDELRPSYRARRRAIIPRRAICVKGLSVAVARCSALALGIVARAQRAADRRRRAGRQAAGATPRRPSARGSPRAATPSTLGLQDGHAQGARRASAGEARRSRRADRRDGLSSATAHGLRLNGRRN